MTDDHHRLSFQARESADKRLIVGIHPVPVQFLKVRKAPRDVIQGIRPLRMPGEIGDLPRRQVGEYPARQRLALATQPGDLLGDVELGIVPDELQLVDFRLEFGDGLFEVQEVKVHSRTIPARPES